MSYPWVISNLNFHTDPIEDWKDDRETGEADKESEVTSGGGQEASSIVDQSFHLLLNQLRHGENIKQKAALFLWK